ncbi:MAG: DNA repair protein RecO [Halofilum sp. (in: g-proteobacteria)]|nr:DNA repair protein RecO [Halofilum sp. (in: g-proteobacteria)]
MSAARGQLARGYVLHARPWRNTSMLVEAFTLPGGRIGLVARGVRRRGSRSRALLQPFQPLLLSWSGRGELHTLTAVEAERWRAPPAGRALLAGFYCNELVLRLLGRDDPNAEAFAAYDTALTALAAGGARAPHLRRFELELLAALGFAPPLRGRAGRRRRRGSRRAVRLRARARPRARRRPPGEAAPRVPGAHLLALARGALDDAGVQRSALRVLRACLAPHLGPRPLRSRELYRAMYGGERA